jgi:two-component system chemotaxis sensor kinase CheA
VSLREQFEVPGEVPAHGYAVVLQSGASCFALAVDETGETQEVVVRPLGAAHRGLAVFAGVTLLGDGRVALILDPAGTARRAGLGLDAPVAVPAPVTRLAVPGHEWLVCELREGWFGALPLGEVLRIEEFGRDQVERLGGQLVARWRGRMLPLVELAGAIDPDRATSRLSRRRLTAVVHESAGVPVGWLVDQVLDAVVTTDIPAPVAPRTGVRGTAELVGHPVDLLDPSALLAPGGSCERLARPEAA